MNYTSKVGGTPRNQYKDLQFNGQAVLNTVRRVALSLSVFISFGRIADGDGNLCSRPVAAKGSRLDAAAVRQAQVLILRHAEHP